MGKIIIESWETEKDSILSRLQQDKTITELVSNAAIDDERIKDLAPVLPQCSQLTSIKLSHRGMGMEGAKALALVLPQCAQLSLISLAYNEIDDDSAKALALVLPQCSHLSSIDLKASGMSAEGAKALALVLPQCSHLSSIDLSCNDIGYKGASALSKALKTNCSLTSVDLTMCKIGTEGAEVLASALRENHTLTTIDLSENGIDEVGASALSNGLKENSTLKSINLSCNNINEAGLIALSNRLKENCNLTSIDLSSNHIDEEGAQALVNGLKENCNLTSINLSWNVLRDSGVETLSRALIANCRLASIDLRHNYISNKGAETLATVLKWNHTLTSIDLRENQIDDEGAQALASALKVNRTLTHIFMSENQIDDEGAQALASALKVNRTLTHIYLSGNNIGEKGAQALAIALRENPALMHISLDGNHIADRGAQALAIALKENCSLRHISLSSNEIRSKGIEALARVLKKNNRLTHISLSHNYINREGTEALASMLKKNHSLTSIDLSGNPIYGEDAKLLVDALDTQGRVTKFRLDLDWVPEYIEIERYLIDELDEHLQTIIERNRDWREHLFRACQQGNATTVQTYLDKGVSLLATDEDGNTPLHIAAQHGHILVVKLLYPLMQQLQIPLTHKNNHSFTAEDLAKENDHYDILTFLLDPSSPPLESNSNNSLSVDNVAVHGFKHVSSSINLNRLRETVAQIQEQMACYNKMPTVNFIFIEGMRTHLDYFATCETELGESEITELLQILQEGQAFLTQALKSKFSATSEPLTETNTPQQNMPLHLATSCINPQELRSFDEPPLDEAPYSIVYRGEYRHNDVAIKQFDRNVLMDRTYEVFIHEVQLMATLRSPNIVQFYGACLNLPFYSIVMEYMQGGSLYNYLHSTKDLSWPTRSRLSIHISKGLTYLHAENIIHRNLKSKNVLLDSQLSEIMQAKLSGFSLSKSKNEIISTMDQEQVGTTDAWMAPELFDNTEYTQASDIYSYGITLWEMASRKDPWEQAHGNQTLIMNWVKDDKREDISDDCPQFYKQLIQDCWQPKVKKRPSASGIVDYLQSFGVFKSEPAANPPSVASIMRCSIT